MKTNWRKYKKKRNMEIMNKKKLMACAVSFVEEVWSIHDNDIQDAIKSLHEIMYSDEFLHRITSKIAVYAVVSLGTIGAVIKDADDSRTPNNSMTYVATWESPMIKYPEEVYREYAKMYKRHHMPIITFYCREFITKDGSNACSKIDHVGLVV